MNIHIPVLKNEVLEYLDPKSSDWIIDATLGLGGHAKDILDLIGENGLLIGTDQDAKSLEIAKQNLKEYKNVLFFHRNFVEIDAIIQEVHEKRGKHEIAGTLFDLGMSSLHIEDPERGFSFLKEGPLDMRLNQESSLTARDIINQWSYAKLIHLFTTYGEEPYARSHRIVKKIIEERRRKPIRKTTELAHIIVSVASRVAKKIHPATRIFQALRIEVNQELAVLEIALLKAIKLSRRIVVISFHSLEDRIVKNIFREASKQGRLKILTKKPVTPSKEEIQKNPRARSAKLRAVTS